MRSVVNISLPKNMLKEVEKEVKAGNYASKSDFFRHVMRWWNTNKLAEELKEEREKFEQGDFKVLRSLRDLR